MNLPPPTKITILAVATFVSISVLNFRVSVEIDEGSIDQLSVGMLGYLYESLLPPNLQPCGVATTHNTLLQQIPSTSCVSNNDSGYGIRKMIYP